MHARKKLPPLVHFKSKSLFGYLKLQAIMPSLLSLIFDHHSPFKEELIIYSLSLYYWNLLPKKKRKKKLSSLSSLSTSRPTTTTKVPAKNHRATTTILLLSLTSSHSYHFYSIILEDQGKSLDLGKEFRVKVLAPRVSILVPFFFLFSNHSLLNPSS